MLLFVSKFIVHLQLMLLFVRKFPIHLQLMLLCVLASLQYTYS
jgi:hypothetical protein